MLLGILNIFGQMLVLFIAVGVGYALKRSKALNADGDKLLSRLVINICLPCMIVASTLNATQLPSLETIVFIFGLAILSYVIMLIVSMLVTRIIGVHKGHRGAFRFMMVFGNVGFIGFPVLNAIFGPDSLIYATIFNIPFNLLIYTVGMLFIASDNLKEKTASFSPRVFLNPCVIASVAAVILTAFGIHGIPYVSDAFNLFGQVTTPIALVIVGSSLANMPVRSLIGGPRLITASAFRLIFMPLILWLALHNFCDPTTLGIIMVLCGMPVAANGTMMCLVYGGDTNTLAQGMFMTTVFSLITIPLLMALLG